MEAVTYFLKVFQQELSFAYKEDQQTAMRMMEMLTHHTAKNPKPKYADFDVLFPKFPVYFRRAAIASAYGKWSSWRSNYLNWEEERFEAIKKKKRFTKKAPIFSYEHAEYPVFYKGNMFKQDAEGYQIKVFQQNDWVWLPIQVKKKTDLTRRGLTDWKQCNPRLVKKGSKYFLTFAYEKKVLLHQKEPLHSRILAVDLGITNSAVGVVMETNGTVLARKFVNQAKEKDHLYHLTNQLKKAQRQTFGGRCPRYWSRIRGLQRQIINDTASQLLQLAKAQGVDTIVFEYLRKMKIPKGFYGAKRLRFKLHYWRQVAVQRKVEEMAHYEGLRISRVLARGTSKYAFDGSGEVVRTPRKDLCTFASGKRYHADLNASYNIGARFYLRAL